MNLFEAVRFNLSLSYFEPSLIENLTRFVFDPKRLVKNPSSSYKTP